MRFICTLLIVCISLFFVGCTSTTSSTEEVNRQYNSPKDWNIRTVLSWNDKEYTIKIIPQYQGAKPLKRIEIMPVFNGEAWPEGYIHPNINSYSWESQDPKGELPTRDDLTKQINKKFPSINHKMTKKEAENILQTTSMSIKVFGLDKSFTIELK